MREGTVNQSLTFYSPLPTRIPPRWKEMEELNSAWVRMTKLLHALEAQANEMDQKMADVRALAISSQQTPSTVPELRKKSGQSMYALGRTPALP